MPRTHRSATPFRFIAVQPGAAPAQGLPLRRRGCLLGHVLMSAPGESPPLPAATEVAQRWQAAQPVMLSGAARERLPHHRDDIAAASALMAALLDGEHSLAALLDAPPYSERLHPRFEMLGSSEDEGDAQEIETLEFDAVEDGEIVAENLWIKASWLSYEEDDPSLRLRFSFGLVGYEDVAADLPRQLEAGRLTEAVFPESALISGDKGLHALLCSALAVDDITFVERIVYFNAPNGGAQFHQDVERGHLGVVFAQASGHTFWLALAKDTLVAEIRAFVGDPARQAALTALLPDAPPRRDLRDHCDRAETLSAWLDAGDNAPLEALLNRCPDFIQQLIEHGHGYLLRPGDMLLLPQQGRDHCAWHTVFCLGDEAGEGLSFAVRARP